MFLSVPQLAARWCLVFQNLEAGFRKSAATMFILPMSSRVNKGHVAAMTQFRSLDKSFCLFVSYALEPLQSLTGNPTRLDLQLTGR